MPDAGNRQCSFYPAQQQELPAQPGRAPKNLILIEKNINI
jgi:hypothetical protein